MAIGLMPPHQDQENFGNRMQPRKSNIILDGSCLCVGSCCCVGSKQAAEPKAFSTSGFFGYASAAANAQAAATNASAYVISAASNSLSGLTPLISSVAAAMLSPEHEGKTFHDSCPEGYCTTGGTDGGHAGNGGVSAHGAGEVRGGKRVVKFSTHTGHHPRS
ncbi:unnamed protein product [Polarella glacialis]|uniref:Uncharacterized protein n=1 Tax=Polarella glacialis TaxID=89957 RepID=A0A813FB42_POLGL|nr:unnamed protein product [Polarella glacialis]|eukprot:CAMPEP_0115112752 /NCGR_PEP_ID=MMETSP0227-20121206/40879_1 /TAXON_ID=89957 /ORGANISM="Polarella glacialis, Strain CCMP 1383" /LENGTH=161 /DNA_ID=CAMNT_0002512483 /DNA_START=76 /DNA_END=561 /DNA_ORIENTATION=+